MMAAVLAGCRGGKCISICCKCDSLPRSFVGRWNLFFYNLNIFK